MDKRVLLILPTRSYRAAAFLEAARRLALELVIASDERSTLSHLHPERELLIDLSDPSGAAELAEELTQRAPIDAVVSADEAGVLVAAHVAQRLGLRGNPVRAVAATRNKLLLRQLLAAAQVGQPGWWSWLAGEVPGRVDFPAVVKPLDQAGSRGVIRVEDARQLVAAGSRIRQLVLADPSCVSPPAGVPLLVEDFVPGPELAVEAIVANGHFLPLAVYDKPEPLNGPYFEETIYTVPSSLDPAQLEQALATVRNATQALGLTDGPIHAELRLGGDRACLIDLAARSIGGRCSRVLRFRSGQSLEELILLAALGQNLGDLELESGVRGVMMMPIPKAGVLNSVSGLTEALSRPAVDAVEVTVPRGGNVVPLPEGDRYLGFIFAHGEAREVVAAELRGAYQQLGIVIDG